MRFEDVWDKRAFERWTARRSAYLTKVIWMAPTRPWRVPASISSNWTCQFKIYGSEVHGTGGGYSKIGFWAGSLPTTQGQVRQQHSQKGASQSFYISTENHCPQELEVRHRERGYKTRWSGYWCLFLLLQGNWTVEPRVENALFEAANTFKGILPDPNTLKDFIARIK